MAKQWTHPPLRRINRADRPALLALNNDHATELSLLSVEDFDRLQAAAFHAACTPDQTAFLFCFDQDADYDSPNFLWFKARYARFVYIDRIVVAAEARGRGLARLFYDGLFAAAGAADHRLVTCEVNSYPANPASDALHHALGFAEVGHGTVGEKRVRYLLKSL